jgi:hypothetical protein
VGGARSEQGEGDKISLRKHQVKRLFGGRRRRSKLISNMDRSEVLIRGS